ncbi:MAG: hypothetical protein AAFX06_19535, partial [Planctomycetota bacterium]
MSLRYPLFLSETKRNRRRIHDHKKRLRLEWLENRLVLANVSLSAGSLSIDDAAGVDDDLLVTVIGTDLHVIDSVNGVTAGAGVTQLNANTATVPLSSLTGGLDVTLQAGDDLLTLDIGSAHTFGDVISILAGDGNDALTVSDSLQSDQSISASAERIFVNSDLLTAGDLISLDADIGIDVAGGVTLSSRALAPGDSPTTGTSISDSGAITLAVTPEHPIADPTASTFGISLGAGSMLLAQADSAGTYQAGDVSLTVTNSGFDNSITVAGATLRGNNVALTTDVSATTSESGDTVSVAEDVSSIVTVSGASVIDAVGNFTASVSSTVTLTAMASPSGAGSTTSDAASADVSIDSNATLTVSGTTDIAAGGNVDLDAMNTITATSTADGLLTGVTTAGSSLALADVATTTVALIQDLVTIDAGGTLTVGSTSSETLTVTAEGTNEGATANTSGVGSSLNSALTSENSAVTGITSVLALSSLVSDTSASNDSTGLIQASGAIDIDTTSTVTVQTLADAKNVTGAGYATAVAQSAIDRLEKAQIGANANLVGASFGATATGTSTVDTTAMAGAASVQSGDSPGSIAFSRFNRDRTDAVIAAGASVDPSGGDFSLKANGTTTSTVDSGSGTSVGKGTAIGAHYAFDEGALATIADSVALGSSDKLKVEANTNNTVTIDAKAGDSNVSGSVDASSALSHVVGQTVATIGTGGGIDASGDVSVSATRNATVTSKAAPESGVAAGSDGAMIAMNFGNHTTTANLNRSADAGGALSVKSTATLTETATATAAPKGVSDSTTSNSGSDLSNALSLLAPGGGFSLPSVSSVDLGGELGNHLGSAQALNQTVSQATATIGDGVTLDAGMALTHSATHTVTSEAKASGLGVAGSGSFGGASAANLSDLQTEATVGSGVTLTADSHSTSAKPTITLKSVAEAAGDSSSGSRLGSLAWNELSNTAVASVADTTTITATGESSIKAPVVAKVEATAGVGITPTNSGLAASLATNDVDHDVTATLGQNANIDSVGFTIEASLTGSVTGTATGGVNAADYADAGSAALNDLVTSVDAHVSGGTTIDAGAGAAAIKASDDIKATATAGSYAIATTITNEPTTTTESSGFARANNEIDRVIVAYLDDTNLDGDSLSVSATNSGDVSASARGGERAELSTLGGSVANNDVNITLDANVDNTSFVVVKDSFSVKASDSSENKASAGQTQLAGENLELPPLVPLTIIVGGAAVGAATAANDVVISVHADVEHSNVGAKKISISAENKTKLDSKAVGGLGAGNFANGGSIAVTKLITTVDAHAGQLVPATLTILTAEEKVSVEAKDETEIKADAGQTSIAGLGAVGASFATNEVYNTVRAYTESVSIVSGDWDDDNGDGSIGIKASSKPKVTAKTAAGEGAGGFALGASVSNNIVNNTVDADARWFSDLVSVRLTEVSAKDQSEIKAEANSVAVAGFVAIGSASATNNVTIAASALQENAKVLAGDAVGTQLVQGSYKLSSESTSKIESKASAGSGAVGGSSAESVATNLVGITVNTRLEETASDTLISVYGGGPADIKATDDSEIKATAGSAVAAGVVAIGAAVATNTVTNSSTVFVNNVEIFDDLSIEAKSGKEVKAEATGGEGALGFAGGGSIATNVVIINVTTTVNNSDLNIQGNAKIKAENKKDVTAKSGNGAGAAGAAVGAAISTNTVTLGTTTTVTNTTIDAGLIVPTGEISIEAGVKPKVKAEASGGTGAGVFALGGSVSTNVVTSTVNATADNVALTAPGAIKVKAADEIYLEGKSGVGVGAGGAAVGAAIVNNTLTSDVDGLANAAVVNSGYKFEVLAETKGEIKGEAAGGAGAGGFAMGGSVVTNVVTIDALATLSNSIANVGGETKINGKNEKKVEAKAGTGVGAGIVALGAAITTNTVTDATRAVMTNSTVNGEKLTVKAERKGDVKASSVGGVGAGAHAAGGSVATNVVTTLVSATVDTSVINLTGDLKVDADDTGKISAESGIGVGGGANGLAASIATNTVTPTLMAALTTTNVNAYKMEVTADRYGDVSAKALGGDGAGSFALGGSVATNVYTLLMDANVTNTNLINLGSELKVSASSASKVKAETGNGVGAGAAAFGAAVSTNTVTITQNAIVANADIDAKKLTIKAETLGEVSATAAGGVGAGSFAMGGSVATNVVTIGLDAHAADSDYDITDDIEIKASNEGDIKAQAGHGVGAGLTAFGAAVATNTVTMGLLAYDPGVVKGGSLKIEAKNSGDIKALAASGDGAGTGAVAGSVATNVVNFDFDANLTASSVDITNAVEVAAKNSGKIEALSGVGVGAGAIAFGAAIATNTINMDLDALVDDVLLDAGSVKVLAETDGYIAAKAAGGVGAGTDAAAGSVALNNILFQIDALAQKNTWTVDNKASVKARAGSCIHAHAAMGVGGGIQSDGVADARNVIDMTMTGKTTDISITAGEIEIAAERADCIEALAGGGAGAGLFADGVSIALNDITQVKVLAEAINSTLTVQGTSLPIKITAKANAQIKAGAGNGVGAGLLAVGGADAQNKMHQLDVRATADDSDLTADLMEISAKSTGNIVASAGGGAGAGLAAASGSIATNDVDSDIVAQAVNYSTLDSFAINIEAGPKTGLIASAGNGAGAGLAAEGDAIAKNILDLDALAEARDSELVAVDVDVVVKMVGEMAPLQITASAGGGVGAGLAAAGGSIADNMLDINGQALVTYSTIESIDLLISAKNEFEILAGSGTGVGAGLITEGAALATNDLTLNMLAQSRSSYLEGEVLKIEAASTKSTTAAAAGGSGAGLFAQGGSIATNTIDRDHLANLTQDSTEMSGKATVIAKDSGAMNAFAGQGVGAGLEAEGAAVALNDIQADTSAFADSLTRLEASSLEVKGAFSPSIVALALGGTGAGGFASGGSLADNEIQNNVNASLSNTSDVTLTGAANGAPVVGDHVGFSGATVSAENKSTIEAKAGEGAGAGVEAEGAAFASNDITSNILASIEYVTMTATEMSVLVLAYDSSSVLAAAAGGTGAGDFAGGGAGARNDVVAKIESKVTDSDLTVGNQVTVYAGHNGSILASAGHLAAAGILAMGTATACNHVDLDIDAMITGSTVNSGDLSVVAKTYTLIHAKAAGGDVAGGAAAGLSDAGNVYTGNIDATIDTSTIQADDVKVEAAGCPTLRAHAGSLVVGALGVGISNASNLVNSTVEADIVQSNVNANGDVKVQAIGVAAVIEAIAEMSINGGIAFSATATNTVNSTVRAAINQSPIVAGGKVTVSAKGKTNVIAKALLTINVLARAVDAVVVDSNINAKDIYVLAEADNGIAVNGASILGVVAVTPDPFGIGLGPAPIASVTSTSTNTITSTVTASTDVSSTLTATEDIEIIADDASTIAALVGGFLASNGTATVSSDIQSTVSAHLDGTATAGGGVTIHAINSVIAYSHAIGFGENFEVNGDLTAGSSTAVTVDSFVPSTANITAGDGVSVQALHHASPRSAHQGAEFPKIVPVDVLWGGFGIYFGAWWGANGGAGWGSHASLGTIPVGGGDNFASGTVNATATATVTATVESGATVASGTGDLIVAALNNNNATADTAMLLPDGAGLPNPMENHGTADATSSATSTASASVFGNVSGDDMTIDGSSNDRAYSNGVSSEGGTSTISSTAQSTGTGLLDSTQIGFGGTIFVGSHAGPSPRAKTAVRDTFDPNNPTPLNNVNATASGTGTSTAS